MAHYGERDVAERPRLEREGGEGGRRSFPIMWLCRAAAPACPPAGPVLDQGTELPAGGGLLGVSLGSGQRVPGPWGIFRTSLDFGRTCSLCERMCVSAPGHTQTY